jgi:thioredoxin reductase
MKKVKIIGAGIAGLSAGLPGAAISGRNLAKLTCGKDDKQFKAITF